MIEWLLVSIDTSRGHDVGIALSWHARLMTLGWGIICPAAIVTARYMKITPNQNWPTELDNRFWWHTHLAGQITTYLLMLVGIFLIWQTTDSPHSLIHKALGYCVAALGTFQVVLGFGRGSKGGPTAPAKDGSLRGDHYDMTPWRLMFERLHRSFGYLALLLGALAILSGLWTVNAPRWMWIVLIGYWTCLAMIAFNLQRSGRAYDTYQAIWGDDPSLPGNSMHKTGWWTVRPSERPEFGQKELD